MQKLMGSKHGEMAGIIIVLMDMVMHQMEYVLMETFIS